MVVVSVTLLALSLAAAPFPGARRPGSVDWERGVVRCAGLGAPRLAEEVESVAVTRAGTERAARRAARLACLEVLRGISITGSETVAARLERYPAAARRVEDELRRSRPGVPRFFADGGAEVDLEVTLDGTLGDLLAGEAPVPDPVHREGVTDTGILVDATGLRALPALAPRLLDEHGGEVYGLAVVRPAARRRGLAVYEDDPARAATAHLDRLGPSPRLVRAIRAEGVDLVISDDDAAAVRGQPCLAEGRVVILRSREVR